MKNYLILNGIFITILLTVGCQKKKDESSKVSLLPLILPAIQETLPTPSPAILFNSSNKNPRLLVATSSLEALSDFFTKSFSGISGTTGTGFVSTSVGDLDFRINELNQRFESEPSCFTSTPYEWTVSPGAPVSSGTPASYSLTLKLNCLDMFTQSNGDLSGAGSGMAWGRDDNYYYIALLLIQSNGTDKFGYFATYNRSTKAVDLLFMESSPSYSRTTVYRVKTNPESDRFEVAIAGAGFSEGPMFPALGCNTRILSIGTEILVAGKAGTTNSSGVCQTDSSWLFNSNQCYSSSDLSIAASTCTSLSTSSFSSDFTEFDGTQVNIASSSIATSLSLSSLSGNVTPVQ